MSVPDHDHALKQQNICIQKDHAQKAWNTSTDWLMVKVNVEKNHSLKEDSSQ